MSECAIETGGATAFTPPAVEPFSGTLSLLATLRAASTNALQMWPVAAYTQSTYIQATLGTNRFLLNSEAGIHRVLLANAKNYRRTPASIRILRPIAGAGLLLSEGAAWRRQRQTIAPALAPRVIPLLAQHVASATASAIAIIAQQEHPIDALDAMQRLTLEIAGRSMFSVEMETQSATMRRLLTEYGVALGRPTLLDYFVPISMPSPRDLLRMLFRRRWTRFIDSIVESRIAAGREDGPRDLFDLLVAARDPDTGAGFTKAQLRDQTATLILAGHETTALTLFWALYLLANDRDAQARVADEVRALDPEAEAARPGLPSLPVTRTVIQEAMRLYPPAFTLAREAIAADDVDGNAVPAGSVILISPWVLHRHRAFWRDPEVFDPTRFDGEPSFAHRYAYLPFGAGPRICVGAQFAMTEAVLALGMLIQAFEIVPDSTRPVRPVAVITTTPDYPATFRFRRRTTG